MSSALKPSPPDSHNESFEPNTGPAVSQSIQQILDTHYPQYATNPHQYDAPMKLNHTTKASLLSNAVSKGYIKHEYLNYMLCVLVEPVDVLLEDSRYLPVVMCIDEGSFEDFSNELVRLFKQDSEKSVELEMKFTGGSSRVAAGEDGWEDIARVLLNDKATVGMIRVAFKSSEAKRDK